MKYLSVLPNPPSVLLLPANNAPQSTSGESRDAAGLFPEQLRSQMARAAVLASRAPAAKAPELTRGGHAARQVRSCSQSSAKEVREPDLRKSNAAIEIPAPSATGAAQFVVPDARYGAGTPFNAVVLPAEPSSGISDLDQNGFFVPSHAIFTSSQSRSCSLGDVQPLAQTLKDTSGAFPTLPPVLLTAAAGHNLSADTAKPVNQPPPKSGVADSSKDEGLPNVLPDEIKTGRNDKLATAEVLYLPPSLVPPSFTSQAAMAGPGSGPTTNENWTSKKEAVLHSIRQGAATSAVTANTSAGGSGAALAPVHRAESPALPEKHFALAEAGDYALHLATETKGIIVEHSAGMVLPFEMRGQVNPPPLAVEPADGSFAGSNFFSQMDSVVLQDRPTPFGMMRTLEVGFQDPGSGAVGVHAHLIGGQVSAVIQVDRENARSMVVHELPAVQQFLSLAQVDVKDVSVHVSDHGSPSHPQQETASGKRSDVETVRSPQRVFPASISTQYEPEAIRLLSVEA